MRGLQIHDRARRRPRRPRRLHLFRHVEDAGRRRTDADAKKEKVFASLQADKIEEVKVSTGSRRRDDAEEGRHGVEDHAPVGRCRRPSRRCPA